MVVKVINESIKAITVDGSKYEDHEQIEAVAYLYGVSKMEARKGIESGEYTDDNIKKACLYKFIVNDQPRPLSASDKIKMLKDLCQKNGIKY